LECYHFRLCLQFILILLLLRHRSVRVLDDVVETSIHCFRFLADSRMEHKLLVLILLIQVRGLLLSKRSFIVRSLQLGAVVYCFLILSGLKLSIGVWIDLRLVCIYFFKLFPLSRGLNSFKFSLFIKNLIVDELINASDFVCFIESMICVCKN